MKCRLLPAIFLILCQTIFAQETTKPKDSIHQLQEVKINSDVIVGSKFKAKTGSTAYG